MYFFIFNSQIVVVYYGHIMYICFWWVLVIVDRWLVRIDWIVVVFVTFRESGEWAIVVVYIRLVVLLTANRMMGLGAGDIVDWGEVLYVD